MSTDTRKRLWAVSLLGSALVVVACGGGSSSGPAPVAAKPAAKKEVAAAADAGTQIVPAYQYAYNPLGKRDPFRSFQEEAGVIGEAKGRCADPLCQWDIDQLKLVAVVSGDANPLAMLEDPNKIGHLVRRGSKVGKQGGTVSQILRDCVVVAEYWTGPDGKLNSNPINLCIKVENKNAVAQQDLSGGPGQRF